MPPWEVVPVTVQFTMSSTFPVVLSLPCTPGGSSLVCFPAAMTSCVMWVLWQSFVSDQAAVADSVAEGSSKQREKVGPGNLVHFGAGKHLGLDRGFHGMEERDWVVVVPRLRPDLLSTNQLTGLSWVSGTHLLKITEPRAISTSP